MGVQAFEHFDAQECECSLQKTKRGCCRLFLPLLETCPVSTEKCRPSSTAPTSRQSCAQPLEDLGCTARMCEAGHAALANSTWSCCLVLCMRSQGQLPSLSCQRLVVRSLDVAAEEIRDLV